MCVCVRVCVYVSVCSCVCLTIQIRARAARSCHIVSHHLRLNELSLILLLEDICVNLWDVSEVRALGVSPCSLVLLCQHLHRWCLILHYMPSYQWLSLILP